MGGIQGSYERVRAAATKTGLGKRTGRARPKGERDQGHSDRPTKIAGAYRTAETA